MVKTIYIQLLDEGTRVYRPVPAIEIREGIYEVKGLEIYNPEDEIWEFPPNTCVIVEKQNFDGENVLVAIKETQIGNVSK
jgi:hypothetical protein